MCSSQGLLLTMVGAYSQLIGNANTMVIRKKRVSSITIGAIKTDLLVVIAHKIGMD